MNFYARIFIVLLFGCFTTATADAQKKQKKYDFVSLFNGKNFNGWDIKIAGYPINENYKNTFQVQDGIIKVNYDGYKKFTTEYGHMYYRTPFSYYLLRIEYRFTGEQTPGGEIWNVRNSGVMIHSQSAASMEIDQSFPVSLEVQYLGGLGKGSRPTGNLCTPGTTVEYDGKVFMDHIIQSSSKTYDGDQWVTADVIVLGDSIIHHFINGEKVLTYTKPKVGGGFVSKDYDWERAHITNAAAWIKKDDTPLTKGYIALQAESHPIEFRKVEILNLEKIRGWQKLDLEKLFTW